MAINNKALAIGGMACVSAMTYGLLQPKHSPTMIEKWGEDGYELISEKTNVSEQAWKDRVELYKTNKDAWSLNGFSEDSQKIKEQCEEYKNKKTRIKDVGQEAYKKITLLCTLNIGEYIKSHLTDNETIISKSDEKNWKVNFKKYEEEIKKKFKEKATEDKAKEVLANFCEITLKLQYSNEHQEDRIKADKWCVNRESEPEKDIEFWYLA